MSSRLKLKIITPVSVTLSEEEITSISLTTSEGQITVLPGHIPLVTRVSPGELTFQKNGKESSFVVTEGFMKLDRVGNLTVLSDYAIRSDEIEIAKVEAAKKKAEEAMRQKTSERDFVVAEAELRKTLLELRVSQKRRSGNRGV
jgi:F-type H+-transporting ATPase subunit epsilon